jgi:nucleoside-diphosphate-sugar epimerase
VTGAAGFIGSHLTEALLAAGHDVVAVDAFTDSYDPELKRDNATEFPVLHLDLAEDPIPATLAETDGIFHLAGQPGVRDSWGEDFEVYARRNLVATQRLLEAVAGAGPRIVLASSSSVYGDASAYPTPETTVPRPISPYGITKLGCEHLAAAYGTAFGLDLVSLRYFTVYGPRQRPDMAFTRILTAIATGAPFTLYGDGSSSRGFTFVDDAIGATVAAMECAPSGAVYNVGGGTETTLDEAIAVCERVSGRALAVRAHGPAAGDVRRTSPDTGRIGRELGWCPRVQLEAGLVAQWQWVSARVGLLPAAAEEVAA